MDFQSSEITLFIERSLAEDLGDGDHSTLASIPQESKGASQIIFKAEGVLAGIELARRIILYNDPEAQITIHHHDGETLHAGTIVADIVGKIHGLLASERLLLNLMQHLSGIATQTSEAVSIAKPYGVKILDTRKTTPGLRLLEKWAVKTGGGENHRIGLFDMIMLKDNHNDSAGGISEALKRTREYLRTTGKNLKVEVETRNLQEIEEVLQFDIADRIMLDNFTPAMCKEAVAFIAGRVETEASGGISMDNLETYAQTGVDYISMGSLTHTVKSLDISMKTKRL